jgi:hypothetical protein
MSSEEPYLGGGSYFGQYGPKGRFGPWAGCGCSSLFIIAAGILLVCGGLLHMVGQ